MSKAPTVEEIKCNVVVLGAGGGGMAAAIEAAEHGVKDIVVLEGRIGPGGNTAMAWGIFAVESPAQRRLGITAGRDEFFRKHMDYCHWKVNARLVRGFINKSGDTIRWLEDMGLLFDRVHYLLENQPSVFHICGKGKCGPPIAKALAKRCKDLGIQMFYRTTAKKLIKDEKGNITGVLAKKEDKELKVTAKCVVIATGGCLGNKELMKRYFPDFGKNIEVHGLKVGGEGLLMGVEAGGVLIDMGILEGNGPDFEFGRNMTMNQLAHQANHIWANKKGRRFTDESIMIRHIGDSANTILMQPEQIIYSIYDNKIKKYNTEVQLTGAAVPYLEGAVKRVWEKEELPELEKDFQKFVDLGRIKISNSWDEIAKWMGVEPKVLKATVDEYNRFCDQGYDEDFIKGREHLMPLRNPPYYAMECHTHVYCTVGGLKTNHRMEVLNHQDEPIRGLYAVGMDAGGWESGTYNFGLAGHSIGFAINSGRMAGEALAEYLLGKK